MTEAQKKAASERMKAMHARKKEEKEALKAAPEEKIVHPTPETAPEMEVDQNIQDMQRQIEEMKRNMDFMASLMSNQAQNPQNQGVQVGQGGRLVGTHYKFPLKSSLYPDPCARLADEQRLQRFAFKDNYELSFVVGRSNYKTLDGVNTAEPKFTLTLIRIIYDEDTGEITNGRYDVCNAIFHEDPDTAIIMANELGIKVDDANEKEFLDEMRYLRMRDWLLEAFYPPKRTDATTKKDMVIGGKVVQYYEINSENSETIPFGKLKSKV